MSPEYRRAALIATAITIPFIVIAAFAISAVTGIGRHDASSSTPTPSSGSGLPGVSVAPPPPPNATTQAACTKVLAQLPVTLDYGGTTLVARPALSTSTFVTAWGDPAVVLRCGVGRPSALMPGNATQIFSADGAGGVFWLPVRTSSHTVWTSVDRAVYIEVTVPNAYRTPPLGPLAHAIEAALPAVCTTDQSVTDATKLCTRRP